MGSVSLSWVSQSQPSLGYHHIQPDMSACQNGWIVNKQEVGHLSLVAYAFPTPKPNQLLRQTVEATPAHPACHQVPACQDCGTPRGDDRLTDPPQRRQCVTGDATTELWNQEGQAAWVDSLARGQPSRAQRGLQRLRKEREPRDILGQSHTCLYGCRSRGSQPGTQTWTSMFALLIESPARFWLLCGAPGVKMPLVGREGLPRGGFAMTHALGPPPPHPPISHDHSNSYLFPLEIFKTHPHRRRRLVYAINLIC